MAWTALCCVCLLQALAVLSVPEPRGGSLTQDQEPVGDTAGVLNKGRPKALFARRGGQQQQRRYMNANGELAPVALGRRCSRGAENCGPQIPCCDPCSTCHCRFFNTICYCWKLGHRCTRNPKRLTCFPHL
ncbi:agouti-related protein-like isoform X1 [Arapaima gigas]